jgi:hypothetical protein
MLSSISVLMPPKLMYVLQNHFSSKKSNYCISKYRHYITQEFCPETTLTLSKKVIRSIKLNVSLEVIFLFKLGKSIICKHYVFNQGHQIVKKLKRKIEWRVEIQGYLRRKYLHF